MRRRLGRQPRPRAAEARHGPRGRGPRARRLRSATRRRASAARVTGARRPLRRVQLVGDDLRQEPGHPARRGAGRDAEVRGAQGLPQVACGLREGLSQRGRIFEWRLRPRAAPPTSCTAQGVREVAAEPGNGFVHRGAARLWWCASAPTPSSMPDEPRAAPRALRLEYPAFARPARRLPGRPPLPAPARRTATRAAGSTRGRCSIGLDVGSTMAKVALADAADRGDPAPGARLQQFRRHHRDGQAHLRSVARAGQATRSQVRGIGVTGSARYQVQQALEHVYPTLAGRLAMLVENYAHARGSIDCRARARRRS
ncbi:MAG: hypothetical protein MZW92_00095 [Comamonadaceae bacterium]|nr:hypothetical protein [Comamonadaceae bacterium]